MMMMMMMSVVLWISLIQRRVRRRNTVNETNSHCYLIASSGWKTFWICNHIKPPFKSSQHRVLASFSSRKTRGLVALLVSVKPKTNESLCYLIVVYAAWKARRKVSSDDDYDVMGQLEPTPSSKDRRTKALWQSALKGTVGVSPPVGVASENGESKWKRTITKVSQQCQ